MSILKFIPKTKKLLDIYKNNLVIGFSYYRLLSSYKGYCVRVRRSSDNAEQYFGFVNNYIDVDGILAFCNGGSGYVSIWYNQYSLGNNAVQALSSFQPRIVNTNTFDYDGLYFNNVTYLRVLNYANVDFTYNNFTFIFRCKVLDSSAHFLLAKNIDSSANIQYGFLSNLNNASCRIEGSDRVSVAFTSAMGSSFINFRTDGNIKMDVNNGATSTATYAGAITSREYIIVGGRDNTGTTAATTWYGNIKSTVGFNAKLELGNVIYKI